jgi:hypothetical protein
MVEKAVFERMLPPVWKGENGEQSNQHFPGDRAGFLFFKAYLPQRSPQLNSFAMVK